MDRTAAHHAGKTASTLLGAEPVKLQGVNATSLTDAITLGCHPIASGFDPNDRDATYFVAFARPPLFAFYGLFAENVAGIKLHALLNAQHALGTPISDDAFPKLRRDLFASLSGPVPLPLHRETRRGPPVKFAAFNLHAAIGALTALVVHRGDAAAHDTAERLVGAIVDLWTPERGWDAARLREKYGIGLEQGAPGLPGSVPLFPGIGGAIGALATYHAATGSPRAKELVTTLRDMIVADYLPADGSYDTRRMGTSSPWAIRMMYVMSQVATMEGETALLDRVRRFYVDGRTNVSNEFGWSPEGAGSYTGDTEGAFNAAFVAEVALTLGRAGDPSCFQHAEQILRARLLPSQLRDVSWIPASDEAGASDEFRNVGLRLRGSWGFPAPYGLKALKDKPWGNRIPFMQDVVGFVVISLCRLLEGCTDYSAGEHRINMLFDRSTDAIDVRSPYSSDGLRIRTKRPGPVLVRLPPWVDRAEVRVTGGRVAPALLNGYLHIEPEGEVVVRFPLARRERALPYRGETIRVRLEGDRVTQMDNFGANLTFFAPLA